MTWHFDPSGQTVDIYDHLGEVVAEGREFSGTWSDTPEVVFEIMDEQAVQAFEAGDQRYAVQCVRHGAFELVEEGTPSE